MVRNTDARHVYSASSFGCQTLRLGCRLPGSPCWRAIGSASLLVLASVGGRRLARTVPDRRVLYPFARDDGPPAGEQAGQATLNIGDGVTEFFGFQGGRLFFVWWIAVPSLALYAAVDMARDAKEKRSERYGSTRLSP